jgi:hypothetical protein
MSERGIYKKYKAKSRHKGNKKNLPKGRTIKKELICGTLYILYIADIYA